MSNVHFTHSMVCMVISSHLISNLECRWYTINNSGPQEPETDISTPEYSIAGEGKVTPDIQRHARKRSRGNTAEIT
jgi:hypothetical protein